MQNGSCGNDCLLTENKARRGIRTPDLRSAAGRLSRLATLATGLGGLPQVFNPFEPPIYSSLSDKALRRLLPYPD